MRRGIVLAKRFLSGDGGKRARGPRNTKSYDWYFDALARPAPAVNTAASRLPAQRGARSHVALSFALGEQSLEPVKLMLLDDYLPVTCGEFLRQCQSGYVGTRMHRVVKDSLVVCGDVDQLAGAGGFRHDAAHRASEAMLVPFDAPGVVGLVSSARDANGSQFFITLAPQPQLSGRCVGFAIVTAGLPTLRQLSGAFSFKQKPTEPRILKRIDVLESLNVNKDKAQSSF